MTTPFFLIDFENVQPKALDRLKPGAARIKVFLGQHQSRLMLELVRALQPFGADAEYIQIQGSGPDAVDFHIAFYIGRLASAHPDAVYHIISKDRGFDPLVKHLMQLGIACKRLPEIPDAGGATPAAAAKAAVAKAALVKAAVNAQAAKGSVAKCPPPKAPAVKAKVAKAPAKPAKAVKVTVLPATAPAPAAKGATKTPGTAAPKPAAKAPTGTSAKARTQFVVERLKKSSKPAKLSTLRSTIKACFTPALDEAAIEQVIQSLRSSRRIVVSGDKVSYALD